jgi:uncharacterized protein
MPGARVWLAALGAGLALVSVGGWLRLGALLHGTPSEVGRVWDEAGLLGAEQRAFIDRYHRVLLDDFDTDLGVLTLPGEADVARLAVREFAARGVGARSRTGRGLLLLIAPDTDRVRLEVSEALEGVFTDAFVAYVQQRQMVPFFGEGRVADGILATTELIYGRALAAQRGEEFDPRPFAAQASGAGAQTAARIGQGYDRALLRQGAAAVEASGSPDGTVQAYLSAMKGRDARPDLPIYSAATREMLAGWTVTPAQMDNLTRTYQSCPPPETRLLAHGRRAVVRYPVPERRCAPWLLVEEDGLWRLDLAGMQRAVRFNHRNEWHFEPGVDHPYADGFSDWRLDRHGFPHARPETIARPREP